MFLKSFDIFSFEELALYAFFSLLVLFAVKSKSARHHGGRLVAPSGEPGSEVRMVHTYPYKRSIWLLEFVILMFGLVVMHLFCFRYMSLVSERFRLAMVENGETERWSGLYRTAVGDWLFGGIRMDLKDHQFRSFMSAVPTLIKVMLAHLGASFLLRHKCRRWSVYWRVKARSYFLALLGITFCYFIHGMDVFKLLFILLFNFGTIHSLSYFGLVQVIPVFTWIFNIAALWCTDYYNGYRWRFILGSLLGDQEFLRNMDESNGLINWTSTFNLLTLRLISFGMDYYWALNGQKRKLSKVWSGERVLILNERSRIESCHRKDIYGNFVIFLGYILYIPLYIAGPTMTYNDFVSNLAIPQQTYALKDKVSYLTFRLILPFVLFYVASHFLYIGAITTIGNSYHVSTYDDSRISLMQHLAGGELNVKFVAIFTYFSLLYIYLKFLVIWRFFRFWALCDDIEPCENMNRCIVNSPSVSAFWRSWHRSFNKWLIRYMYVPLGGNRLGLLHQGLVIFIVFTFVSFWHDLSLKLFAWGWFLVLFILPELIATSIRKTSKVNAYLESKQLFESYLSGFLSAISIVMLMIANAVGYAIGLPVLDMMFTMMDDPKSILASVEFVIILFFISIFNQWHRDTKSEEVYGVKVDGGSTNRLK